MKMKFLILLFLIGTSGVSMAQVAAFPKEITVAADGSGDFKCIQEAINSVRDLGQERIRIYIRKGTYPEKLVIPSWKTNISLVGEDRDLTVISNADFSGKPYPGGRDETGRDKFGTFNSYTVLVQGNDVVLENLTIANTAGPVGQAVALHAEGDRFVAKNCKMLGYQDTLYATKAQSRQFYLNCYIEGTTDFIFGQATAFFLHCTIHSLSSSYITAASTTANQKYGFVFQDCRLTAAEKATKVYLGRPWRPYAKTVFLNCDLGGHITAEGWNPWKGDAMFPDKEKTAYYAEFGNRGEGAGTKSRVAWSHRLTASQAKLYTLKNVLGGQDNWKPLN
ncbi:pectinesterase family protein [Pedobacter africanus]|nr:pectinesterase family protein [Pedobacter africanus]